MANQIDLYNITSSVFRLGNRIHNEYY